MLVGLLYVAACSQVDGRMPTELIRIASSGESVKVRQEACYELGKTVRPGVAEALISFLNDPVLQYCSAQGLGQIRELRAVGALLRHLKTVGGKNRMASWALAEIGDVNALEPLNQISAQLVPTNDSERLDKSTLEEAIAKLQLLQGLQPKPRAVRAE
jgi:hypothetical protein